jgi:hypothetical protein
MSARLFANMVYAWLMAGADGPETRDKIDAALYEPLEGTEQATSRLLRNLQLLGGEG